MSESGSTNMPGGLPLLVVSVQGTAVADILVRILPTTYQEFQTGFSLSLLDELFAARPINPAAGNDNTMWFWEVWSALAVHINFKAAECLL